MLEHLYLKFCEIAVGWVQMFDWPVFTYFSLT